MRFAAGDVNLMALQDMRMKFDGEEPSEVQKSGDEVERSQGAARAISVRLPSCPVPRAWLNLFCKVVH
jgi:hypothetical protein